MTHFHRILSRKRRKYPTSGHVGVSGYISVSECSLFTARTKLHFLSFSLFSLPYFLHSFLSIFYFLFPFPCLFFLSFILMYLSFTSSSCYIYLILPLILPCFLCSVSFICFLLFCSPEDRGFVADGLLHVVSVLVPNVLRALVRL